MKIFSNARPHPERENSMSCRLGQLPRLACVLLLLLPMGLGSCTSRKTPEMESALAELKQKGIIKKDVEVNQKTLANGGTLLVRAAEAGDARLASLLLAAGADPDGRAYAIRSTPLTRAANEEVLNILLQAGADADAVDAVGTTPLSRASSMGNLAALSILLGHGVSLKPDLPADPPLLYVGNPTVAKILLRAGADVNQPSRYGVTPLMYAVSRGNDALARLYLEAGADPRLKDSRGNTALHLVRSPGMVQTLCKAGADPASLNNAGETSLFDIMHNAATVKALIEAGVPVNAVSRERNVTALFLMLGDKRENDRAILELIRRGASVTGQTPEGDTALHLAVKRPGAGRLEMVKALLKAGADPKIPDEGGHLAEEYVRDGTPDAAELRALLSTR